MGLLAKETIVDRIELVGDSIQVRRASYVTEDGVRITDATYHRTSYLLSDPALEREDAKVQAVAQSARAFVVERPALLDDATTVVEAQ